MLLSFLGPFSYLCEGIYFPPEPLFHLIGHMQVLHFIRIWRKNKYSFQSVIPVVFNQYIGLQAGISIKSVWF